MIVSPTQTDTPFQSKTDKESRLTAMQAHLQPWVERITHHPLPHTMTNYKALQMFLHHHVFAVWDFFCLLKALYRELACTDILWQPPLEPYGAHLLHGILGEEEGDTDLTGTPLSHFEWYLHAMNACGANTATINNFIKRLNITPLTTTTTPDMAYQRVCAALDHPSVPKGAQAFVTQTFKSITQPLPALAGAFVFGREGITADLFAPIISRIQTFPQKTYNPEVLIRYFQRHVNLDTQNHFPKAFEMLNRFCQNDSSQWQCAQEGAEQALQARLRFLDAIEQSILIPK